MISFALAESIVIFNVLFYSRQLRQLFFIALSFFIFQLGAQPLKTPKKISDGYGGKFDKCKDAPDNYYVIYKNVNTYAIDLVIAVKNVSGEWLVFRKDNMSANDTLIAFSCTGAGSNKIDFRKSGDKVPLMSYESLNKDFLAKQKPQKEAFVSLTAKILYGEKIKKPLVNQEIGLKDKEGKVLHETKTDEFGDFSFENVNKEIDLELFLKENKTLDPNEKVYLAKLDGRILTEMQKNDENEFVYKLLPLDFKKLSTSEDVEDPFLAIKDFKNSNGKDIVVAESIYFAEGSSELMEEAKKKLDKVVNVLNENNNMKVELSAHTDSKGDDISNLKLSESRAKLAVNYIVSKGIESSRVSGKGYGESKILNRCGNGIKCSENEHRLNRRLEFKFIKN